MSFNASAVKIGDIVSAMVFCKIDNFSKVSEYLKNGEGSPQKFCIQNIKSLSINEYDELTNTLLDERAWLSDCIGTLPLPRSVTNKSIVLYVSYAYLIICEGREPLLIDSQGYSYARYVGFSLEHGSPEIAQWVLDSNIRWDQFVNKISQEYAKISDQNEPDLFLNVHDTTSYGWWKGFLYNSFLEDKSEHEVAKKLLNCQYFQESVEIYKNNKIISRLDELLEQLTHKKGIFSSWWQTNDRKGLIRYKIESQFKQGRDVEQVYDFIVNQTDFLTVVSAA